MFLSLTQAVSNIKIFLLEDSSGHCWGYKAINEGFKETNQNVVRCVSM